MIKTTYWWDITSNRAKFSLQPVDNYNCLNYVFLLQCFCRTYCPFCNLSRHSVDGRRSEFLTQDGRPHNKATWTALYPWVYPWQRWVGGVTYFKWRNSWRHVHKAGDADGGREQQSSDHVARLEEHGIWHRVLSVWATRWRNCRNGGKPCALLQTYSVPGGNDSLCPCCTGLGRPCLPF